MAIQRITGLMSGMDTDSLVKQLMDAERIPVNKMIQNRQKLMWQSDSYRTWNKDLYNFRTNDLFNMKLSSAYSTFNVNSGNSNAVTAAASASAITGTHKIEIQNIAEAATLKNSGTVSTGDLVTADTVLTIAVKGANDAAPRTSTITVKAGDKISNVVSALNSARDADQKSLGIQAYYDSTLKQFVVKTKDTGSNTELSFSGSEELLNGLGLVASGSGTTTVSSSGVDANYKFNDQTLTSQTNTVTLLGTTYTLKEAGTGPVNVTVSRDIEAEIKNIKEFVNKYNEILGKLNTAIAEPTFRTYLPLTDEQKEAMSEKQIEQWELKAKSGLLRRDSTLTELANSMRSHMTGVVNNGSKYNSLSSIGISSTSYTDKGVLTINEDKLRKALQEDPDAVKNLFMQDSTDAQNIDRGVIARIYDDVGAAVKKLTEKAGATTNVQADTSIVGELISDFNDRISNAQLRLISKENSYYSKFAAMERALSKYDAQAGWLAQQFGGGM